MPRWVLILIGLVLVIWLMSDAAGFAGTIKDLVSAIITFVKALSS